MAFDEHDGLLRIATTRHGRQWSIEDNAVTILAEQGTHLVQVGQVGGLGKTEEIKAVRWFDDLAVVVTFRQTDPLYTIDLADPRRPEVTGELKITGFSAYLHPIGDDLVLGIGQAANRRGWWTGSQVSTFDLADLGLLDRHQTRNAESMVEYDARAFTYLPELRAALVPTCEWSARTQCTVAVWTIDPDGTLTLQQQIPVSDWGTEVRTLPLTSSAGTVAVVDHGEVTEVLDLS